MSSNVVCSCSQHVKKLNEQITVMRKEIKNLRQMIDSAVRAHRKQVDSLLSALSRSDPGVRLHTSPAQKVGDGKHLSLEQGNIQTVPIGYISSCFPGKIGTPRQPSICGQSRATLQIEASVFNNPHHALIGLELYSHVWILFLFHKNGHMSYKAKVKPPRLNGQRVGVYSTRSPHRPNALGLTLAKLESITGDTLHLSGIDMIAGTPVLDIKPYIPEYDSPCGQTDFGKAICSEMGGTPPGSPTETSCVPTSPTETGAFPASSPTETRGSLLASNTEPCGLRSEGQGPGSQAGPVLAKEESTGGPAGLGALADGVAAALRDVQSYLNQRAVFPRGAGGVEASLAGTPRAARCQPADRHGEAEVCYGTPSVARCQPADRHGEAEVCYGTPSVARCQPAEGHGEAEVCYGTPRVARCQPAEGHGEAEVCYGTPRVARCQPAEGHGDAEVCYGEASSSQVASWIRAPPVASLAVRLTPQAEEDLRQFQPPGKREPGRPCFRFLQGPEEAETAIRAVLCADPRSVYRRTRCPDRLFYFVLDSAHITCWFGSDFAEVVQVRPIAPIPAAPELSS